MNALGEGSASTQVKATPTLGLKIYPSMDEGEGSVLYNHADTNATTQAATLSDQVKWITGKYGKAISLTATKQCMARLKNGITTAVNHFTVACWVRPTTLTQWARVFDFGTGTSEYMFLSVRSNNNPPKFAIKHNGTEEAVQGAASHSTNVWAHLVVTLQDSTLVLHVNGNAVARNAAVGHRPSMLGTTTQNHLGQSQWSSDPFLNAALDEFRFYTQAMTAEQVKELYRTNPLTVGIEDVYREIVNGKSSNCKFIYDLSGRHILKPKKGIYIINGHKVAIVK